MRKEAFLFEPLTGSKIETIQSLKASGVFISYANLDKSDLALARKNNLKVNIEIGLFVGKEFWDTLPDSRPIDGSGQPIEPEEWYYGVCPNHPIVRRQRLSRIKEIASCYPIDGLWLDFIRYPGHWEVPDPQIPDSCYCPNCLSRYQELTEQTLPASLTDAIDKIKDNPDSWQSFREQQIIGFVTDVRKIINDSGKKIELGAFVMPDPQRAIAIAQNLNQFTKLIDTITPMLYHAMCGRSVGWIKSQIKWATSFGKPILPIIQTEDKPRTLSTDELLQALETAAKSPSAGVIILFLENLLKNPNKTSVFRDFNR